uniref:Si:ch73-173p19.1 n=1 Tax=Xiphophorus couchianus TaxID=32473 RepID=A0A3B5LYR0_9TELE
TIGEFFLILSEMGFTEQQIQAAVQAGHLSVTEAAELLQGQYPRHTLVKQTSKSSETALSAFNPPKDAGSSLVLKLSESTSQSPDPLPVESRIKQDKSDFEEKERQRVAQKVLAEKRQKKEQEREMVLKRIAEDRKTLQEKSHGSSAADMAPPSSEGQKLGGKVQTNVDNNCILMIRLPSGESMRERFSADAPLRSVVEHISGRHPSLSPFSLLQGFPRKRFGEAELACSLRSLGLTPNAALCIQTTPPETPQDPPSPADPPPAPPNEPLPCIFPPPLPQVPFPEEAERLNPAAGHRLPDDLWEEAVNYAGIPRAGPPVSGPSHFWRGQRLVPGDLEDPGLEAEEGQEAEEEPPQIPNMPRLPFFPENRVRGGFEPRHFWPDQGNRLDPADPEEAEGPVAHVAAGQAAVERLQRAALQEDHSASQGQPTPPKRPFRTPNVPSLCALAIRATVHLMTPSMQYSSSLAGLTPELAELLLSHMSRERLLRPRTLELFFGCQLQKLVLNCYPYSTNELLRQLRAFTTLKHLSLVNSPLITSGLSVLLSLVKLQSLNLASCSKLTDSCLQYITSLDQTKVTDAGMVQYLQSAPSCLSQLSLNQTEVTEATLAALPTCVPQLRLLSIKQTKVKDISALAGMSSLQTLNLNGTGVTEESLESISTHPTLSSLSLGGISVKDGNHALKIISLKLTHLTLPGRHTVTDRGLEFLCRLTLLSELDLKDYTQVTDQGVSQLAAMTLKKLSLSNTQVTDTGLPSLRGLQELQELCLDRTAVTSRGVAELITCLPQLQVLGLASTHVGDSVVRRGLIHCHQLVKINLSHTRITDQLKHLKDMRLAQVNLDGTGVSLMGIANLLSLTNIGSVRATNTRTIP